MYMKTNIKLGKFSPLEQMIDSLPSYQASLNQGVFLYLNTRKQN